MADLKTNGILPIDDDALADVSGGTEILSAVEREAAVTKEAVKSALGGTAGNAAGSVTASSAQNTALAYCPVCGKKTEFLVLSGGRAFCKVCGTAAEL